MSFASSDRRASGPVWRLSVAVGLVGVLATAILAWWTSYRAEQDAAADLANQGQTLARSIEDAIHEVTERLGAMAGLYRASDEVTQSEFLFFSNGLDRVPGMGGIGYVPIVAGEDLAEYEARIDDSIPGYYVFELDDAGNRVPVEPDPFHAPLQWFEPRESFDRPHGFDAASDPARRSALVRARSSKEASVTSFLRLVSEGDADGFLIYWPVVDPVSEETTGFTVAPMDLSELLEGQISPTLADELEWEIVDLADVRQLEQPPPGSWSTNMDVGSNVWRLAVTRSEDASPSSTGPGSSPLSVVVGGLITSLLAAAVFYQYRLKTQTEAELERLRDITRAKDQFLASVSHELRTPLTGVLGFAELLRNDQEELSDEERRAMITSVAGEATDLAAIIDDLLVAARSELDLLAITRVPVSSRAQVAQVVETTDPATRERITIVGEGAQIAMGDPGRVRQIVRNLVANAVRYGGDRIEIRFSSTREMAHLDVADDGPGLPSGEWERVFQPYYRIDQSNGTQPAALGIGLSVARHLARLMEGDVVYRRDQGWSVFRLSLPIAPANARQSEHEPSVAVII